MNEPKRYTVRCYSSEHVKEERRCQTAGRALEYAYAFIGGSPFRAAHIYADHSTQGIYIARHTDEAHATRLQLLDTLEQTAFGGYDNGKD